MKAGGRGRGSAAPTDAAAGSPDVGANSGATPGAKPGLSTARLFFGVEPDDSGREAMAEAMAELSDATRALSGIRWVEPRRLHVTLKFLGECPTDQIPAIVEAAAGALETASAASCAIEGVGIFSSGRRQSVVYAEIPDGAALRDLAGKLETALEPLGYGRERRTFRAHITLARVTSPEAARSLKPLLAGVELAARFPIDTVVLFRSTLGRGGPVYTPLAHFPLP